MSDVLRVYLPDECNDAGIPLDWLRCRACQGVAVILNMDGGNHSLCEACGGHGSLKAAAPRTKRPSGSRPDARIAVIR